MLEHNTDFGGQDLSQVTTLKIIGGEPFMEQKRFVSLMRRLNLSNLELCITTNGTVLPNQELQELISQCRLVSVHLSLDGIDSVAEWYRWPTKFTDVKEIMRQMESWWADQPNVYLYTKTLINIYNVWTLDQLVEYICTEFPVWEMYFDWIYSPAWQSVNILTDDLKKELDTKLQLWSGTVTGNWNTKFGNPFAMTRDRLQDPAQSNLEEFKQRTLALAQERKLDVINMVPEIKCLIN
jgi:sulfatase maturation enzyme AslB (radical SAM superfamily)